MLLIGELAHELLISLSNKINKLDTAYRNVHIGCNLL